METIMAESSDANMKDVNVNICDPNLKEAVPMEISVKEEKNEKPPEYNNISYASSGSSPVVVKPDPEQAPAVLVASPGGGNNNNNNNNNVKPPPPPPPPAALQAPNQQLQPVVSGGASPTASHEILTTNSGGHPVPFAKALYRMIKEHPDVISWESSTGSLIIPDPKKLEKTLLDYFRHGRYASFQRQLNNFGYRRVGSPGPATVYRREVAPGEQPPSGQDIAPESILSLRHVLRRSNKPSAQELQRRARQPVKLHHPRFSDPNLYPDVESSPRNSGSSNYDIYSNSPALAAHALLSLKAQIAS